MAVAGWSGAVHIYATDAAPGSQPQQQHQQPRAPVLSIPPPTGPAPAAAYPPQEGNLVAGLAWRGGGGGSAVQLELLVLRYSGHFARHVLRPPPR